MHYAFLVALFCSGFECEIQVIEQWQSENFREVVVSCYEAERSNKHATCIFDSEEL